MKTNSSLLSAAVLASALGISSLTATPIDSASFTETEYARNFAGLGFGTGLAWAPDGSGQLFVTRKDGEVRVVLHNPVTNTGTLVATPWATISPVFTNGECGVVGLCFDPDFINNRFVYFFVTVSAGEQQIIRCTDNPATNTGGGKTTIVAGLPTMGTNHNGGAIAIGPDGRLYWAIGDNTNTANNTGNIDANVTSLAGKVSRANRFTGAALNDNPFFDDTGTNADHIWARGFRNPFTMAFQPGTGKLWLNVVGSSFGGDTQPRSGPGYEQVFVVARGDHGGWNDYENNQAPGFITPVIAYRTGGVTGIGLTAAGARRQAGVVTFTTGTFHPFRAGAKVTIAGVGNPGFNGDHFVAARLNDTQFTVAQAGPDAESGGGSVATLQIGSANGASLTGGCFYDSTAWPAAYRGNFFAGDSVTGTMFRATMDASNTVTSVDLFATNTAFQQVDTAVGPDGALYFLGYGNGAVRRIAHQTTAQNVIVQPFAFDVVEGGSAVCNVRLAQLPAANVSVAIAKLSGDADLTGGTTLTFTTANWNQTQTVTISAAQDADYDNDAGTFRVSSPGLPDADLTVNGIDNDEPTLRISTANLSLTEGGNASFFVTLQSAPPTSVTLSAARTSGDSDITVTAGAALVFTPLNFATPQPITVAAAEDANSTPDTATISVSLAGEPVRTVSVTAADNELVALQFTSSPVLTAVQGQPYNYDVNATGNPAPVYSFSVLVPGMSINNTTGLIQWTPATTGNFNVGVRAQNAAGSLVQSFTITVSADAPPVATITTPLPGAVISGAASEFFGDGTDDAGTIRAEFFVDGLLRYTDVNSLGHYHIGGTHGMFDTTQFTNGPHALKLRVTDTIGQTGEQEVAVLIGNGYEAWRSQQFTPAETADDTISGDTADPDHDGIPNLAEYAFYLAPKSPALTGLPVAQRLSIIGADYPAITFTRVKWAADITYTVEVNDRLADPWTQIDPLVPANQVSLLDDSPAPGLQTITVRDTVPFASGTRRFIRLRVAR